MAICCLIRQSDNILLNMAVLTHGLQRFTQQESVQIACHKQGCLRLQVL